MSRQFRRHTHTHTHTHTQEHHLMGWPNLQSTAPLQQTRPRITASRQNRDGYLESPKVQAERDRKREREVGENVLSQQKVLEVRRN